MHKLHIKLYPRASVSGAGHMHVTSGAKMSWTQSTHVDRLSALVLRVGVRLVCACTHLSVMTCSFRSIDMDTQSKWLVELYFDINMCKQHMW